MPAEKCVVTFGGIDPNVQQRIDAVRAIKDGPNNFALETVKIVDAAGKPVRILKKDEKFFINVTLIGLEFLYDLQPTVIVNVTCMDLSSCEEYKAFCASCEFDFLCDNTEARVKFEFECKEEGVFTCAVTAAVGESDIFDFDCFNECFACHPSCVFDISSVTTQGHGVPA